MNQNRRASSSLTEAWQRLESLGRRLWDENSACAVEAQAVIEEFKGEVGRIDAHFANIEELRDHDRREREEVLTSLRRQYEEELAVFKRRVEVSDEAIHQKDRLIEDLQKSITRKEEENLNFHSQMLREAALSDEAKGKKMEEFYQELLTKDATLEQTWQKRHKALEEEYNRLNTILSTKQSEQDAWQQKRIEDESNMTKRATDLELKSQQLQGEYRKKQQEIEDLKASLQRSITDLVRQYQTRVRAAETPAPSEAR